MAAADANDIWTLRGVTKQTRDRFKAAASAQGTSIGQLANDVLSSAADALTGRHGKANVLDSSASHEQDTLARLTQLEARVAVLEASLTRRSQSAEARAFDPLDSPEDLLVGLFRTIEGLPGHDRERLGPESLKTLAILQMLPAEMALDELLTFVVRETLDRSGNVVLSARIGAAIAGLVTGQQFGPAGTDVNAGA